jgi:hypothetical protein
MFILDGDTSQKFISNDRIDVTPELVFIPVGVDLTGELCEEMDSNRYKKIIAS